MKLLEKVRVLDLSPFLPSQYCSHLLAQLGAEVTLVERPGNREEPFPGLFELLNCGKQSLQLDLKTDFGKEVFYRLARKADVVIEGFRPGVAARLKIGYEDLKQLNPELVYCSVSGFGQTGPYRDKPGHDINYLALSGYFSIPGQVGAPPSRPGIPVVDLSSGVFAAFAVMAALMARGQTGEGQHVDIGMLDVITSWTSVRGGAALVKKEPITDAHVSATNGVYQTKDGQLLAIGLVEEHFWQGFCQAAGRADLLSDKRFAGAAARMQSRTELGQIIRELFLTKTRAEWLALFKDSDVPVAAVSTLSEAFADPQIEHRQLLRKVADPRYGEINVVAMPVKFSGMTTDFGGPPPRTGEHTAEILRGLGYSEEQIAAVTK